MTPVSSPQSRVKAVFRSQNSEQRAHEGSAMLTVASANVRTLAPKQDARGHFGMHVLEPRPRIGHSSTKLGL